MRNPSKENPKEIKPKKIWDPNIIIECGEIKPKDGEEYPSKKKEKTPKNWNHMVNQKNKVK